MSFFCAYNWFFSSHTQVMWSVNNHCSTGIRAIIFHNTFFCAKIVNCFLYLLNSERKKRNNVKLRQCTLFFKKHCHLVVITHNTHSNCLKCEIICYIICRLLQITATHTVILNMWVIFYEITSGDTKSSVNSSME